jgi:hypothetical protein
LVTVRVTGLKPGVNEIEALSSRWDQGFFFAGIQAMNRLPIVFHP